MVAEKKWLSLLDVTWEAPDRNPMKVLFNHYYESWVVPAGVPSALADIGGGVGANN